MERVRGALPDSRSDAVIFWDRGPGTPGYCIRKLREQDEAEKRGRREWLDGIKHRLGLVTMEDTTTAAAGG